MPAPAEKPSKPDTADHGSTPKYQPPRGVQRELKSLAPAKPGSRAAQPVHAAADWLIIREHGVPAAEVFYVSYSRPPSRAGRSETRPVMFLFNGGPGAASAFLHMGTAGPLRVDFQPDGRVLPAPARVLPNQESWLDFADLVFVDPVGTGFSRTVHESRLEQSGLDAPDEQREKRAKDAPENRKGFFKIKRDIDVLCEFVSQWLSKSGRWSSPVWIAGESYGGFRVGKLVRALPERGVGLAGAIMVSPAIDFLGISGSDYDVLGWINAVPTMAQSARVHKKLRGRFAALSADKLADAAESFALRELAPLLLLGDRAGERDRDRTLSAFADLVGLDPEIVRRAGGRLRIDIFARELLRERGLICGLYDAAMTSANVFPDRELGVQPNNPDPSLDAIVPAFASSVNVMLREHIGLSTDREYTLMCNDAWKQWTDDRAAGYWDRQLDCADDIRFGLANSPAMPLLITHGRFDLVTTYFSTAQTVATLRLPEALRRNVHLKTYDGGHMFYTWESSRRAVRDDVRGLVTARV